VEVALVTDAPLNPYVRIEVVSPNITAGATKFDTVQTMKYSGLGILTSFVSYGHPWLRLVVWWSELLTSNHEVPGSIPCSTMGIFLVGGGSPW
jgi:hypothetical protein